MPFDSENYQPSDEVLTVLHDARQWLSDPAHWCQGTYFASNGATCIRGAVLKFSGYLSRLSRFDDGGGFSPLETAALDAVDEAASAAYGRSSLSVNDSPSSTLNGVQVVLDRAIAARKAELLKKDEIGAVARAASA